MKKNLFKFVLAFLFSTVALVSKAQTFEIVHTQNTVCSVSYTIYDGCGNVLATGNTGSPVPTSCITGVPTGIQFTNSCGTFCMLINTNTWPCPMASPCYYNANNTYVAGGSLGCNYVLTINL